MQSHPRVGQIPVFEVYLRRAACPLADNPLVLLLQAGQGRFHRLPGRRKPALVVLAGATGIYCHAVEDDLGSQVALRLEQNRVHLHRGRDPGGPSLQSLRIGNLMALRGDVGIQRHVLGLERGNLLPRFFEKATEGSYQKGFAHVGRSPHDHQGSASTAHSAPFPSQADCPPSPLSRLR